MTGVLQNDRRIRWLHPVAWWSWALCAAAAASLTSNPLALIAIATAASCVVVARGAHAPWAASISGLLKLAAVVIAFRVLFQTLLGAPIGLHVLLRLPEVPLPGFLSGIRLGGVFTTESLVLGVVEGLRFAAILLSIAAATTVAAPSRLFRALPDAVSGIGTVLVIAMTFAPHLVQDFSRIRTAQRLRGRRDRGVRAAARALGPVVDGAMDRSLQLASAMTSRGYGRARATRHRPDPWRRIENVVVLCGIAALAITVVQITTSTQTRLELAPLQWPTMSPIYLLGLLALAIPAFLTPLTPGTD